jgi:hypothetical protein
VVRRRVTRECVLRSGIDMDVVEDVRVAVGGAEDAKEYVW